jgi:precorrin-6B methylase 2
MSTTQYTDAGQLTDEQRAVLLATRISEQFTGAVEVLTIELGRRLGLYDIVATGPLSADTLAAKAGIARRYAQEWLDQQAAAGFVDVVETDFATGERTFVLSPAHVAVLADHDSLAFVGALGSLLLGVAQTLPAVAEAYASQTGVDYAEFGDELRFGLSATNKPAYIHLARSWVEAAGLAGRLDSADNGGGVIVDAGCGEGWSSIALATAFPHARVVAIDLDEESAEIARRHVETAGLAERVQVLHGNAADTALLREVAGEEVVLVAAFEALHDMGEPVAALTGFHELLSEGGAVLVADHVQEDAMPSPAERVERSQYAMSVLHCLPATWAESHRVVNGTVLRVGTLQRWVREAGFGGVEHLAGLEHPMWRFFSVRK